MQLIAETYDLMKRGLGLTTTNCTTSMSDWNEGELNGYLLEITGHIFSQADEKTGKRLIDVILDVARQKGTGMWTSQSAHGTAGADPDHRRWPSRCATCRCLAKRTRARPAHLCRGPSAALQATAKAFLEELRPRALCRP